MTRRIAIGVLALVAGCRSDAGKGSADGAGSEAKEIVVYNAGSLARPLRAVLDSFAAANGVRVLQENAGSLETARKLTELGKIPDVIALADVEVFPQLLVPGQTTWYARFARNRMVLAYTPRSRFAAEITPENWWQVVQRPGVEVGRADPNLDPNGYRTLLVFQLAERHYRRAGLERALLAAAPARNVRPKEADLVGLLQAGELDYAWSYESLAQSAGLRFLVLPAAIDLGTPADSATYAAAVVRVAGRTPRDTLTLHGQPISYALSVPLRAPHPGVAARFVDFLFSPAGLALLRGAHLDVLDRPIIEGTGAPAGLGGPR
jgi:molybdate/tungstate transport system substrate-binding protein